MLAHSKVYSCRRQLGVIQSAAPRSPRLHVRPVRRTLPYFPYVSSMMSAALSARAIVGETYDERVTETLHHHFYHNTHCMPTRDRREDTRITYPQPLNTMHPQEGVHDAAVFAWRHARCARRVVQRLDAVAHDRLDLRVRLLREVVVEQAGGIRSACGVEQRGERARVHNVRDEACGADENGGVVLRREVPRRRTCERWRAGCVSKSTYSGSTIGATDGSADRSLTVPVLVGLQVLQNSVSLELKR